MSKPDDIETVVHGALSEPASDDLLAALDVRVAEGLLGRRDRRNRWLRPRLLVAIAIVVLLVPLAIVGAQTLLTESPLGLAGADEFQAEIDAAKGVVPLPPDKTWPAYLSVAYDTGLYSRGGGRVRVEAVAFCLWSSDWVTAKDRADGNEASSASRILAGVTGWEYYRGRFATQSLRDVIDRVIAAVGAGDEQPVRVFIANNCASS